MFNKRRQSWAQGTHSILLCRHKPNSQECKQELLVLAVHICNGSTGEVEAGGLQF